MLEISPGLSDPTVGGKLDYNYIKYHINRTISVRVFRTNCSRINLLISKLILVVLEPNFKGGRSVPGKVWKI